MSFTAGVARLAENTNKSVKYRGWSLECRYIHSYIGQLGQRQKRINWRLTSDGKQMNENEGWTKDLTMKLW